MNKTGGNFFEEHIEKIVLAIVGLVSVWLLVTRVVISPNYAKYGNDSFSPSDIDLHISKQADLLERKLSRKPKPSRPYEGRFREFVALVESAVGNIDDSLYLPKPNLISSVSDDRRYRIPLIGEVNDAAAGYIRAVAYVPTEEIDEENTYDRAKHEPNDIDFVTVEAKFDVAGLYKSFYESFAGEDVPREWCDPCLAQPIFAAVQLQRQELDADGSWSDWQILPRTNIDHRKKMFESIEEVEDLPIGGMKVRLLQYDNPDVRMDLLQPQAYSIASAGEEWFPPSLHKEYIKYQKEMEVQEKREAREAERERRELERQEGRIERSGRGLGMGDRSIRGMGERLRGVEDFTRAGVSSRRNYPGGRRSDRWSNGRYRPGGIGRIERGGGRERPTRSREVSKTKSVNDFYDQFNKILITGETDLSEMREPLVFWAHDGTVEPENSYRYRIRLGVFNPIAGTDQLSEQDKSLKNKVILWSEFSYAKETVDVPGRLYFFPLEIQEAAKTVKVKVSKYALGYWCSKEFPVKQGEVIGKVAPYEAKKEEEKEGLTVPETIDYATGAVLVDSVPVNDWSGPRKLHSRLYFDMLYSFDGINIEHMPINQRYWAKELRSKFVDIKQSENEVRKPWRPWGGKLIGRRPASRAGAWGEGEEYEITDEEKTGKTDWRSYE